MKTEDVERIWCLATAVNGCSLAPLPEELEKLTRFASAIESHVRAETVAMCKEKVIVNVREVFRRDEYDGTDVDLDWSTVDAAVKEESRD
jgi:hypothetical protein